LFTGISPRQVVLAALVVESPGCSLAKDALQALEAALPLYEEGSRNCRPPATLVTVVWSSSTNKQDTELFFQQITLRKLLQRASSSYTALYTGPPQANTGMASSNLPDELALLGGRSTLIRRTQSASIQDPRLGPGDIDEDAFMAYYEALSTQSNPTGSNTRPGFPVAVPSEVVNQFYWSPPMHDAGNREGKNGEHLPLTFTHWPLDPLYTSNSVGQFEGDTWGSIIHDLGLSQAFEQRVAAHQRLNSN
jgi:hypothetical protein